MRTKTRRSLGGLALVSLFLGGSLPAFATPPAMPTWRDPVTAYVVFVRFPDAKGRFEIEVFCEANFDIEKLTLRVNHAEEIAFDDRLPSFSGKMKARESKAWRVKGTARPGNHEIPPSILLVVQYLFPYDKVLTDVERQYAQDPYPKQMLLRRLERVKGKTLSILKPLPVSLPRAERPE